MVRYPGLVIIPAIHKIDHVTIPKICPQRESIQRKGKSQVLEPSDVNITQITTENVLEIVFPDRYLCSDPASDSNNDPFSNTQDDTVEKKFIISPTDNDIHYKLNLRDADVEDKSQLQFEELY